MSEQITPLPGEIAEALQQPNGWVYRIVGEFSSSEDVPPDAIVGAWRVDETGMIVGGFKSNPNFDSEKWGSSTPPV